MSNHIFRYKYRSMDFSIMNTECMTDEFWDNSTIPRPRLDDGFFPGFIESLNFGKKSGIYMRSFLETTCHVNEKLIKYKV